MLLVVLLLVTAGMDQSFANIQQQNRQLMCLYQQQRSTIQPLTSPFLQQLNISIAIHQMTALETSAALISVIVEKAPSFAEVNRVK